MKYASDNQRQWEFCQLWTCRRLLYYICLLPLLMQLHKVNKNLVSMFYINSHFKVDIWSMNYKLWIKCLKYLLYLTHNMLIYIHVESLLWYMFEGYLLNLILFDMFEWLTCRTSNLRIASRMCSNHVRDKPLFPWARNFTIIAQYWLGPGTDSRVFL